MARATQESRTVTLKELTGLIRRCMRKQRPAFIWGPPGLGKSDIVAQIARDWDITSGRLTRDQVENGAERRPALLVDLRAALMDPTDFRGVGYFNPEKNQMNWAPPVDLPDAETAAQYDAVILFLDELNSAPPVVQAAAYQLILNRRIGTYNLPANVAIVAAGNRESDKGVTYRMPSPLANRFMHYEVRCDFDSWFEWAVNNDVHPEVAGYLQATKSDLFDFDPASASRAFATPRSWSFVSEMIGDSDITESEITEHTTAAVGEGIALKFAAHRKMLRKMPTPKEVLEGKVTKLDNKEISARFSLIINCIYEVRDYYLKNKVAVTNKTDVTYYKYMDNLFRFLMDHCEVEMSVMALKVAMTTYGLPLIVTRLKHFGEFHARFGKHIAAAAKAND